MEHLGWHEPRNIQSQSYTCGYCGNPLASNEGWFARLSNGQMAAFVYICHHCTRPTFFDFDGKQTPGVTFGNSVKDIPDESVHGLYDEARKCTGVGGYTAAVLCCRKLLMHIAVSKGAKTGQSFINYVEYLADNHYVPPDAKDWVDHIRKKGNEANHEISIMKQEDAQELLSFVEMLLKVIFEFPVGIKKKASSGATA